MQLVVYKKKVKTSDQRFQARSISIVTESSLDVIPIDDAEVICNSCNGNINGREKEEDRWGWMIYLSKNEARKDRPYDFYCDECTNRSFPKAEEVQLEA